MYESSCSALHVLQTSFSFLVVGAESMALSCNHRIVEEPSNIRFGILEGLNGAS